jgi:hypothetical protein
VKNDPQSEISFRVNSLQDLTNIIIPHFLNYPLLAKKAADFYLFKQVTELMKNKAHLLVHLFLFVFKIRTLASSRRRAEVKTK